MSKPIEVDSRLVKDVTAIRYALVDEKGHPCCLVSSITRAIGAYGDRTNDIILSRQSRMRIYDELTRKGWSIRRCRCTVRLAPGAVKRPTVEKEK
jgi:hypothetical protein